jgi:hypothetical protein
MATMLIGNDDHRTDGGHLDSGELNNRAQSQSHLEGRLMSHDDKHSRSSHSTNHEDEQGKDGIKATQTSHAFQKYTGNFWSSVLPDFKWIPQNSSWSHWKPVIRCALAAWICGLLFIIPKTENAMGQVCSIYLTSRGI